MQAESSDRVLLEVLQRNGAVTISVLVTEMEVTATAVRQRLQRLMADGLIQRQSENIGRGRPNHRYSLTEKGERAAGTNFADMADVLWDEIKSLDDPAVRRGLLKRIAARLADRYRTQVVGGTLGERMAELAGVMQEREIPFKVEHTESFPVLSA